MDEELAPILNEDCMLFSPAAFSLDDDFQLTNLQYTTVGKMVKTEIQEDTRDHHFSTSESPSSSLSSPDMKDTLGVDLSFCMPFASSIHPMLHSPTNSNGSSFGQMFSPGSITEYHSPLPPVSQFSHQMPLLQQELSNQRRHTQQIVSHTNLNHAFSSVTPYTVATPDSFAFFDAHETRTPSPPTSDRSTPANGMLAENTMNGTSNNLSSAQQQLKSRNKMHEIAVRQRLITDQDPRSEGLVQLSAEERRTLVQEGYPIPTRLPLSKSEEESLKIVRRKIKNKLSAQESRRKRKEYMDNLESRCQAYFNENSQLKSRVRQLELSNQKLAMQMRKLQNMVSTTEQHSDIPVVH